MSEGQINAYTRLAEGAKIHNETKEIHIFGFVVKKDVLVKGEPYKEVNSKPLTIAKELLRNLDSMKSTKYRNYKLSNMTSLKVNGHTLEVE